MDYNIFSQFFPNEKENLLSNEGILLFIPHKKLTLQELRGDECDDHYVEFPWEIKNRSGLK